MEDERGKQRWVMVDEYSWRLYLNNALVCVCAVCVCVCVCVCLYVCEIGRAHV